MTITDASPLGRADRSAPTILRLSGELDVCTCPALHDRLQDALRTSSSRLVLDLSGVSFCDASGLSLFVGLQQRGRPLGVTVVLAAPRPFMSRLLRITGLDRGFPITGVTE